MSSYTGMQTINYSQILRFGKTTFAQSYTIVRTPNHVSIHQY